MGKLGLAQKKYEYPVRIREQKNLCYQCNIAFTIHNPAEYDHLNNNDYDSRSVNLALICRSCNNRKKFNSDMQIIGHERLVSNEKAGYVCERTTADIDTILDDNSCIAINKKNKAIANQFLHEWTSQNEELILKDAVDAITNLCYEMNGSGSQSAIYKYIDSFTNKFSGKFTIYSNDSGKNCIRLRIEN